MLSLLNCLFAAAMVQCMSISSEQMVKRDNVTLPMPIVAMPSQHWEGNDGIWSTFVIRVGSPPVIARVLPATSWQEVWVIANITDACNTTAGVPSNCQDTRGATFNSAYSKTWVGVGSFSLGANNLLGYGGVGQYGFDTIGLGYDNSTGIVVGSQVVSEITSDQWWMGQLGMGFQSSNISGFGDPKPSFSESLLNSGLIASRSWSYTAGAAYRLKRVFGSLIFGGYDIKRFTPNNVTFTMAPDNLRDIVVTIREITATVSGGNTTTLMSTPEFAFIDSTVPEFWLPPSVCQAFENVFSLSLDPATNLYLLNESTHASLLAKNPSVIFKLGNQKTGGETVDIKLPYASFDLNVSAPIHPSGTSYYFPLKIGQNDSMYTLGRTFLQEAYVTTHFNSRTFDVSQALFPEDGGQDVVAIPRVLTTGSALADPYSSNNPTSGSGSSHGLSGGGIAGIVIGSIAALAILALLLFCCRRRGILCSTERRLSTPIYEIDSGKRVEPKLSAYLAQASARTCEVHGSDAKFELGGNPIMHPQELEAEVPILPGNKSLSRRINHDSDSSGKRTDVSSLSNNSPTRRAELHGNGLRQSIDEGSPRMYLSSPRMPVVGTGGGFEMEEEDHERDSRIVNDAPEIIVTSPGVQSNATWTPITPAAGRFDDGRD